MTTQIWNGLLATDRLARYFQRLEDKLRWRFRIFTFLLIVSASGAMGSLLSEMPSVVSVAAMFLAACLSAWLYVGDYAGKAAAAGLFCAQYQALAIEWEQLWYVDATQDEVNALQWRQARVAVGYHISIDHSLNDECEKEAYAFIPQKFAAT